MTISSAPLDTGFERAPPGHDICDFASILTPSSLVSEEVLRRVWHLAFGGDGSFFERVVVVGDRETLDEWVPEMTPRPSLMTTVEYIPSSRSGSDEAKEMSGSDEEDEDCFENMFVVGNGDFVVLLPGEYHWRRLWKNHFEGQNLIIGISGETSWGKQPIVYEDRIGSCQMVECTHKTCITQCEFEIRANCKFQETVVSNGKLRLVNCCFRPKLPDLGSYDASFCAGGIETGDFVVVRHGASLLAEAILIKNSTCSLVACEGRCLVVLRACVFDGAGRGDHSQHISKALGTFPDVLAGSRPAIAVSYAATIRAKKCKFSRNNGYPLQYSCKEEHEGTVGQHWLDKNPKEYAREKVAEAVESENPSTWNFDLATAEGKESMYQSCVEERVAKIVEVANKRRKGSVELEECRFEQNTLSPHLDDIPDKNCVYVDVEPWFSPESKMMKVLREDGCGPVEPYYEHGEAVADRAAWDSFSKPSSWGLNWNEEYANHQLSEEALLMYSLLSDASLHKDLNERFQQIYSHPRALFYEQFVPEREVTNEARSPTHEYVYEQKQTAYGMMEKEQQIRDIMLSKKEECCRHICETLSAWTNGSTNSDEALAICWGGLACGCTSIDLLAGILVFHEKTGREISPYRAEVLVDHMQCKGHNLGRCTRMPPCFMGNAAPVEDLAFVLGCAHDSVVKALCRLLADSTSTSHGRSNAGAVLTRLAFVKTSLRTQTVEVLSSALLDDSLTCEFSHQGILHCLADLRAGEKQHAVIEATRKGRWHCSIIRFRMQCGLKIDKDDPVVAAELEKIAFFSDIFLDENRRKELREKVTKEAIVSFKCHNSQLKGRPPCDECGKLPPKGDPRWSRCSACKNASYCSPECQRSAWKFHRKMCRKARES